MENEEKPQRDMQFYTCRTGNVKFGTTKNGNPFLRLGLVIKAGPRKGEWLNYMMIITPKTKDRVKKDLEMAGVTLGEGNDYTLDGRLVTAMFGYSEFWKEDQVLGLRVSKFQPDPKAIEDEAVEF